MPSPLAVWCQTHSLEEFFQLIEEFEEQRGDRPLHGHEVKTLYGAYNDPDNQPLTKADLQRMKRKD